jgi:hypothetical protein
MNDLIFVAATLGFFVKGVSRPEARSEAESSSNQLAAMRSSRLCK